MSRFRPSAEAVSQERNRPAPSAGELRPGWRVLHPRWGVGQVVEISTRAHSDTVTVQFANGRETVEACQLRRLLMRTELISALTQQAPHLTAWTIRKATECGEIAPDVLSRFAGHRLHLYEEARVPQLVAQLSRPDAGKAGALVLHRHYGAGRLLPAGVDRSRRAVHFIANDATREVAAGELRPLLSTSAMARRIGVPRRTFQNRGPAKGIFPDYLATVGRQRAFYDAGRVAEIRSLWKGSSDVQDSFLPGALVIDSRGGLARVKGRDAQGNIQLASLSGQAEQAAVVSQELQPVVSTRALARTQGISRYKLNRLLTTAGVEPVYRDRNTTYFARTAAERVIGGQMQGETNALSLAELADRTSLSRSVLGRKVRRGLIESLSISPYRFAPQEAERLSRLLDRLRDSDHGIEALGICRCERRGRVGREVVSWDIPQLVRVGQDLSVTERNAIYQQIAWVCEGTGQRALKQGLNEFIESLEKATAPEFRLAAAAVLLPLLGYLPPAFAKYRRLWREIASLCANPCQVKHGKPAKTFRESPPRLSPARRQMALEQLVTTELRHIQLDDVVQPAGCQSDGVYCEDAFVCGAVVLSSVRPELGPGVVVHVARQSWNASACRWDKVLVVRFSQGEQQLRPSTWNGTASAPQELASMVVLLKAGELARGRA